jgi:predicted secreted protein
MRVARWSTLAVAVLLLAGCGQSHAQTYSGTLHLTANLNKKVITVEPHTAIVVTLASNPSTGYHWQFVPGSSPTEPLRLVSHRYVAPKKSGPGAAGTETWRFRAVSRGALPIGFVYRRSSQPEKVVRFVGTTIEVS